MVTYGETMDSNLIQELENEVVGVHDHEFMALFDCYLHWNLCCCFIIEEKVYPELESYDVTTLR